MCRADPLDSVRVASRAPRRRLKSHRQICVEVFLDGDLFGGSEGLSVGVPAEAVGRRPLMLMSGCLPFDEDLTLGEVQAGTNDHESAQGRDGHCLVEYGATSGRADSLGWPAALRKAEDDN